MKKKSVKYLLHFMLLCMPLLLLLIACIFPTKQINNTYALEETTTIETETTLDFNQKLSFNEYLNNNTVNYYFEKSFNTITFINYATVNQAVPFISNSNLSSLNGHKIIFRYTSSEIFETNYGSTYFIYWFSNNANTYRGIPFGNNYFMGYVDFSSNIEIRVGDINYLNKTLILEIFDLTQMGLEDITYNDFINLFPSNYYYTNSQEITLSTLTITNNVGNDAQAPLQSNETKQPNEAILMPYKSFYSLEVNNWYRSLLELIGVDISSTDLVQGYLLYFPLWAMWFWLFELIELAVTLVPKLVYEIYTKLSRSKDE